MPDQSAKIFAATSRRFVVKGGAALLGVSVLGLTSRSGLAQAPRTRMDIVSFAGDAGRLTRFEGAIKEMQDRSASNPNDPKGWLANANMHRDFCSIASSSPAQIHFCWWFLAWHPDQDWPRPPAPAWTSFRSPRTPADSPSSKAP